MDVSFCLIVNRGRREKKNEKKNTTDIFIYTFLLSDYGHVLEYAHDDECSFKLTSAEARRSAVDSIAPRMRGASERETKKKPRREYRHRPPARHRCHATLRRYARGSVSFLYYHFAGQYKHHIWTLHDCQKTAVLESIGPDLNSARFPAERFVGRRGPLRVDFRSSLASGTLQGPVFVRVFFNALLRPVSVRTTLGPYAPVQRPQRRFRSVKSFPTT